MEEAGGKFNLKEYKQKHKDNLKEKKGLGGDDRIVKYVAEPEKRKGEEGFIKDINVAQKEATSLHKNVINPAIESAVARAEGRDDLTGLLLRKKFKGITRREMERAKRTGEEISIGIFDVDHFKKYNDTYGHIEGDRVLRSLAVLVEKLIRQTDVVSRWGGEEFIVLLPSTSNDSAGKAAEKLRLAIEKELVKNKNIKEKVTVSIGVAEWDKREELEGWIGRADGALYQAKENGRNRVEVAEKNTKTEGETE